MRSPRPGPDESVEQSVRRSLDAISSRDRSLRSLVLVDEGAAIEDARRLDAEQDADACRGALRGLTFVVKDNVDVAGQVTACGSRAHHGRPAAQDAPVVARLRAAGAVLVGRANMDELAMGASTATSVHGATRNPHDVRRSPGGSSGGCAAAVAAGLVDLAIGTDTGGSIREPASQCGVLGLAPSPALVPVDGVVPFDPSCDRVGPLAADPDVLAAALAVMSGVDVPDPLAPWSLAGLRVGVPVELAGPANQPGVLRRLDVTVERLRGLGADVRDVSLPDAPGALAAYLDLTSVAALPHLRPWVGTGRAGPEVVRRLRLARALLQDDPDRLVAAAQLRERLREQTRAALTTCDVLVSPTMPTTAPAFAPAGPPTPSVADPMTAPYTDCWTVVANLAGLPALSVPAGVSPDDDLPIGVMLMGSPGDDVGLVTLAAALVGG